MGADERLGDGVVERVGDTVVGELRLALRRVGQGLGGDRAPLELLGGRHELRQRRRRGVGTLPVAIERG